MTPAQLKGLRRGDLVRHKSGGGNLVVLANYGDRVTAVTSADLTNPNEWDQVDASGAVISDPEASTVLTRSIVYDYCGRLYQSEKRDAGEAIGVERGPFNVDDPNNIERDKAFLHDVAAAGKAPALAKYVAECLAKRDNQR